MKTLRHGLRLLNAKVLKSAVIPLHILPAIVLEENERDGDPAQAFHGKHTVPRVQFEQLPEAGTRAGSGLPDNPTAALKADLGNGITQFQDAKGRVMVRIPGMGDGMLWKTAIKSFGLRKS